MKKQYLPLALISALSVVSTPLQADDHLRWETGHGDLRLDYTAGNWDVHFTSDASPGAPLALDETVLVFNDAARKPIPDLPNFAFLGSPGDPIWIMPQVKESGSDIVFLGVASQTSLGIFQNDEQFFQLTSVSGPGKFFMWTAGSGIVTVHMNSSDGIDANDRLRVSAQSHLHNNWAFSAPGTYTIGLKAEGTPSGQGAPISSEELFLNVEVGTFATGDVDIDVTYEQSAGELHLGIHQESTDTEFESDHVALKVNARSWARVPNDSAFEFLGELNSKVLILPQSEIDGLLFLGVAGGGIPAGTFENDNVSLNLVGLTGPGQLAVYETDTFGSPTAFFQSANGIDQTDSFPVLSGGHRHANWAFTKPGVYRIDLQASGIRSVDQQLVQSEVATFLFEVFGPTVFSSGEVDVDIALENGEFHLGAHQESTNTEFSTSEILFRATPLARTLIPDDPQFAFLGTSGDYTFVLPQSEEAGVLFLGIATGEIETGVVESDRVDLELVSVDGPGEFALYQTDAFGTPTVLMNTADGIDGTDTYPRGVGEHVHANWTFSTPGVYTLGFQVSGTLVAGSQFITSDVFEVRFDVIHPEVREEGELDFEVVFNDGEWELAFLDEATESEIEPSQALIIGTPLSLDAVPSDAGFSFLGPASSPVWIFPQSEIEGVIFLGIAGDEIALGTFENDAVSLTLAELAGPGDFAMYQLGTFGTPTVFMNTRDGLDSNDVFPVPVGPDGHAHVNWAFSSPGKYQLTFQSSGILAGETEPTMSNTVKVSFVIEHGGPVLAPQLVDGGSSLRLDWMSKNTATYQLQSRSDVQTGSWADEDSPFAGVGGPQSLLVPRGDEVLKIFQLIELEP